MRYVIVVSALFVFSCKCIDCTFSFQGTATLSLSVVDINDHTPEFPQTGYVFHVNQYTGPGDTVNTVVATDIDHDDNGDVEYTWNCQGGAGSYYNLNTNGIIHNINQIDFDYGTTHRWVYCVNNINNALQFTNRFCVYPGIRVFSISCDVIPC